MNERWKGWVRNDREMSRKRNEREWDDLTIQRDRNEIIQTQMDEMTDEAGWKGHECDVCEWVVTN